MISLPSGSSKRAHVSNGAKHMSCLVDGCNSDLSKCRDYHKRHRVCEQHCKTPIVIVDGQDKRFCQQCSKYVLSMLVIESHEFFSNHADFLLNN